MNIGPFENIRQLLGCYRFMKADVEGAKAVLPKPDQNQTDNYQIFASRAALQDKHCFIADVENFCKWYYGVQSSRYARIPVDCLDEIFISAYGYSEKSRGKTFGQLALRFRERINRGEKLPRILRDKGNIWRVMKHMRDKADEYFQQMGYIE